MGITDCFDCECYRKEQEKTSIIVGSTVGGVVLLAGALVLFGYCWCQRAKAQEKTAMLTAKMTGYDDEVGYLDFFFKKCLSLVMYSIFLICFKQMSELHLHVCLKPMSFLWKL